MDSVRGLVGKWNADAAKAREAGDYGIAAGREDCADELESALQAGEAVAPDMDMARHWIERYASGIDPMPQMDRIADCFTTPADSAPLVEDEGNG